MKEYSLSRTPLNIETAEGVVVDEPAGLLFMVGINGRPILCRGTPGLPLYPVKGNKVVIQISAKSNFGLIISVIA